ncbi:unnamed protein product [Cunninghamella blakesleeana]
MENGSTSFVTFNTSINDSPKSSTSPMNSPSPTLASYTSPMDSPSGDIKSNRMSLEPPNQQPSKANNNNNTFVHKLFNMVIDPQYQHLIAWSYTGASFIVCNIVEFSKEVLPKHFKHNNFSSFVRQLNMYGFHKVNKSPRGHRTLAENQIWEFSHTKFMRDRHDLLDEIKRKVMETDNLRRDANDMSSHLTLMQMTQNDIMQQLSNLQKTFEQVVMELNQTKQKQAEQDVIMGKLTQFLSQRHNTQLQLPIEMKEDKPNSEQPPSIMITSPDVGNPSNYYLLEQQHHQSQNTPSSPYIQAPTVQSQHQQHNGRQHIRPTIPLTVQTQNLTPSSSMDMAFLHDGRSPISPAYSDYHTPLSSTPVSPNTFYSDDDNTSNIFSPHTPLQHNMSSNSFNTLNQQQQLQNNQMLQNQPFSFQ